MFLKRKIIRALDEYEDIPAENVRPYGPSDNRERGITQGAFISWFREQGRNKKYSYKRVDKCINDCIEDGYIASREDMQWTDGQGKKIVAENICVSSPGRDFIKKSFFYLKYLPERFGDLKVIVFTVASTIITSPLWSPAFKYLGNLVKKLLRIE